MYKMTKDNPSKQGLKPVKMESKVQRQAKVAIQAQLMAAKYVSQEKSRALTGGKLPSVNK